MSLSMPYPDAALRERLAHDPHRPRYHFVPPHNWLNDPNGVIQFQGEYHLFYQYNPAGPTHGNIHWGHAVSRDLVHWNHLPMALAPTPGSYDEVGVWSGCAVDADGTPVLIYTGVQGPNRDHQRVCLAFGDAALREVTKHPGNPVIPELPPGLDLVRGRFGTVQYRDPCVWREADGWYLIVGAGIVGVGGTALLYRSPDLITWEYLHPLCVGDVHRREPRWTGIMWECPDFFPLGDQHLLMFSPWDNDGFCVTHQLGSYTDHRFTPEREAITDYGTWYAPQSFADEQGRRICWGWLREARTVEAQVAAGWSGVMALPRVLSLLPDGDLGAAPAPELAQLRRTHQTVSNLTITPGARGLLPGLTGASCELALELDPGEATTCGLIVRQAPAGTEETRVCYERATGRLWIDRSRSSLDPASQPRNPEASCPLSSDGTLRLRLFLDGSVLELFANECICFGDRIYPSQPDSLGIDLFAEGGAAHLQALDWWEMTGIWGA